MNIEDVEAFLTAVRTGTISKAAEQLYITQPTISYRIQSLEKALGYPLLDRSRGFRKIEVTDGGREFYSIAEKMFTLWNDGKAIANRKPEAAIRIAITNTLNTYVMPSVLSAFAKEHPNTYMDLYVGHYPECYAGIENNNYDFALLTRTITSDRLQPTLIGAEKMVLICSKKVKYSDGITPSELSQEKELFMYWNPEYYNWHSSWFSNYEHKIKTDNVIPMEGLIETTDYWTIVPLPVALNIESRRNIHHYEFGCETPKWPIYLLTLSSVNPMINEFVGEFKKHLSSPL